MKMRTKVGIALMSSAVCSTFALIQLLNPLMNIHELPLPERPEGYRHRAIATLMENGRVILALGSFFERQDIRYR